MKKKPTKAGQLVKFSSPYSEDEAKAIFIIKEIFFDVEKPRAIVDFYDPNVYLTSSHVYLVNELEVIS